MAAAAFTGTLIFKGGNGRVSHIRVTMSDVAAAAWVFPDGSTTLNLPADTNWSLVDVIIVTGGTDTTNSEIYVNQANTGITIDHKSNLNTVQYRQFITNPIGFKAASQIKLIQRA
jgi:hypothetical protein